ncbi:hypothetical protein LZ32DRAFT_618078 [Colletotrichum eremochloae]|nr:hypothetical protein LZ32DRAFT_618078 [Colletotrichum eremochloae]
MHRYSMLVSKRRGCPVEGELRLCGSINRHGIGDRRRRHEVIGHPARVPPCPTYRLSREVFPSLPRHEPAGPAQDGHSRLLFFIVSLGRKQAVRRLYGGTDSGCQGGLLGQTLRVLERNRPPGDVHEAVPWRFLARQSSPGKQAEPRGASSGRELSNAGYPEGRLQVHHVPRRVPRPPERNQAVRRDEDESRCERHLLEDPDPEPQKLRDLLSRGRGGIGATRAQETPPFGGPVGLMDAYGVGPQEELRSSTGWCALMRRPLAANVPQGRPEVDSGVEDDMLGSRADSWAWDLSRCTRVGRTLMSHVISEGDRARIIIRKQLEEPDLKRVTSGGQPYGNGELPMISPGAMNSMGR